MNDQLMKKIQLDGYNSLKDLQALGERKVTKLYGKVALKEINKELKASGLSQILPEQSNGR